MVLVVALCLKAIRSNYLVVSVIFTRQVQEQAF